MINHMPEVAKMLGVELDEEFEVPEYPTRTFRITIDGIEGFKNGEWSRAGVNLVIFEKLLTGEYIIKRKPWKPKDDEVYWFVDEEGKAWSNNWCENDYCLSDYINYYKLGNCYRTKEEAEANRDKWVAFYASDEVLEV